MKRLNNRGVSLIEILIAVVIFALCVTPIIAQLASSIRIGQKADDQQAATDYGKSVAETMKQMELMDIYSTTALDQLAANLGMESSSLSASNSFYSIKADGSQGTIIPAGSYLTGSATPGTGNPYASVTTMYQTLNTANASLNEDQKEALVREYHFTGVTTIDHRTYDVDIELDTSPYAMASLVPSTDYKDPNAVNLGNLSSLDSKTTALITRASNSDATASVSYFNAVISALENSGNEDDAEYAVQLKNGNQVLTNTATKVTSVVIEEIPGGDANGNHYQVTCELIYSNPTLSEYGVAAADTEIKYTMLEQRFEKMPEVYLMYNQFLYNNNYADDTIQIDNRTDVKAKVYIIRTAATNEAILNNNPGAEPSPGETPTNLIPTGTGYGRDDRNGSNYLYMTQFNLVEDIDDHPVSIYTNIPVTVTEGATAVPNVSSSTDSAGNRTCKMSINVPQAQVNSVVYPLDQDERYSEQGRVYNIVITLTNQKTGNVTTFDTSKGDY